MSRSLYDRIVGAVVLIGVFFAAAVFIQLYGCASIPAVASSATHPTLPPVNQQLTIIQHGLTILNLAGVVCLAASIALLVTPISAISKIAIPASLALVGVTLAGIIILPYAKVIIFSALGLALAFGIYELIVYAKTGKASSTLALAASALPPVSAALSKAASIVDDAKGGLSSTIAAVESEVKKL